MKQTDSHLFFYAYQTLNRNFSLAFLCFTSCLSYSYRLHFKQLQHLQAAATGSAVATVRLPAYGASIAGEFNPAGGGRPNAGPGDESGERENCNKFI